MYTVVPCGPASATKVRTVGNRRHILLPLGAFIRMTAGINFWLRISNWLQEEPLEVGRSALFLA
jgi:hypothetical protein